MDTYNSSRNEKMWDHCFDAKNFPEIKVEVAWSTTIGENELKAKITIKGETREYPLTVTTTEVGNVILARGKIVLKISELKLPDPSIAIAKVRDEINLSFAIEIDKI